MGPYDTPPAAEAFDDAPLAAEADTRRGRPWRLIWLIGGVLALTLVVLAVIGYSALTDRRSASVDIDKLPIVHADQTPYKTQPEQPGGLDIPNRDKLIYGRLRGRDLPGRVERLIPEPEKPLSPPAPPPAPAQDEATQPTPSPSTPTEPASPEAVAETPAPGSAGDEALPLPKPKPVGRTASVAQASSAPVGTTTPVAADRAAADRAPTDRAVALAGPATAATPAATKPSAAGGGYRLQIAALPTEARATAEWGRLSNRHADLLRGLKPDIVRADLGDRGVVYRLRVGPIVSEQTARGLCQSLSGRGVGCLVVAPRG